MGGGGGDEDGAGGARSDCDAVLQASGKSLDSLPGGVPLLDCSATSLRPCCFKRLSGKPKTCCCAEHASLLSMRPCIADLAAAVAAGKVSKELLQRYLQLSQSLLAPFMRIECVPSSPFSQWSSLLVTCLSSIPCFLKLDPQCQWVKLFHAGAFGNG